MKIIMLKLEPTAQFAMERGISLLLSKKSGLRAKYARFRGYFEVF